MTQVKLGDKNIPFIYQGNELLYPNPVKDGLVLWYDFKGMKNSDITKGVSKDLSGNGNNGTLNNFAYTDSSGYNNGLNLDGIDDDIEVKNNSLVSNLTESITINLLFEYKENVGKFRWIVSNNSDAPATTGFAVVYNPSSVNPLSFRWGGEVIYYSLELEKNKDYLFTFTSNKESGKTLLYLDGKLIKENDFTGTPQKSYKNLFFGKSAYYDSEVLNSIIKSIQIYNRALSDQEIKHNYNLEKERWNL